MDLALYILKSKYLFYNDCLDICWSIVVKRETIYLTNRVCLIIIRRNTPNLLDMSCIYKRQQQRYNTENTKIYMLLHYMYLDIEALVCKYSSK